MLDYRTKHQRTNDSHCNGLEQAARICDVAAEKAEDELGYRMAISLAQAIRTAQNRHKRKRY